MSKGSPKRRQFEIQKKQKRRKKLQKLRERYFSAKTEEEKEEIIQKIERLAPYISIDVFKKEKF